MTVCFADIRLDVESRQLFRGRQEVHLSPKAFDLLALLVAARPRAISKSELHDRLWPGTFVAEANISILISEVRSALGDSARKPKFIRTVHRFGYAFAADALETPPPDRSIPGCWVTWGGRRVALTEGPNVIGRDPDATVWVDSPGVSRRHACITVSHGEAELDDLRSKNGTFVRGARVTTRLRLENGDDIRLGSALVTFRIRRAADSTRTEGVS